MLIRAKFVSLSFLFSLFGALLFTPALNAAELSVTLTDVRNDQGQVAIAVFSETEKDVFPKKPERAVVTKLVDAKAGEIRIPLGVLKPGTYAVSFLHDENRDGDMNFNFVGMPKEGFGFSNNPRIYFGAPSFKTSAFQISEENLTVVIRAKYF